MALSSPKAFIVDYGAGNLGSIARFISSDLQIHATTSTPRFFQPNNYDLLVIPGVGNYGLAAPRLTTDHFTTAVAQFVQSGKMVLGICLGAQLLGHSSEEAKLPASGLGLLPFHCVHLESHPIYSGKTPRTGWSTVRYDNQDYSFYFVHSFYMQESSDSDYNSRALCVDDQVSAYMTSTNVNVHALQFHPEKSAQDGFSFVSLLLKRYA